MFLATDSSGLDVDPAVAKNQLRVCHAQFPHENMSSMPCSPAAFPKEQNRKLRNCRSKTDTGKAYGAPFNDGIIKKRTKLEKMRFVASGESSA